MPLPLLIEPYVEGKFKEMAQNIYIYIFIYPYIYHNEFLLDLYYYGVKVELSKIKFRKR